jgi:hypothetical protein
MKHDAPPNLLRREVAAEFSTRTEYTPHRALTFLDKLYRDGAIDSGMWRAGVDLRDLVLSRLGRSEGVGGYGDGTRATDTSKADRAGERLTGFRVHDDGTVTIDNRKRRSRANERHLEDALFAACGCHDSDGEKRTDRQAIDILVRVVMDSEKLPTLTSITLERTSYYGAKSKQTPPFAMGFLHTLLGRLAKHFRYMK